LSAFHKCTQTTRAALQAEEIAKTAEFFSFGTNDATQTTFGISRDDAGAFLSDYQKRGIFMNDPFSSIDVGGRIGHNRVERGRKTARISSLTFAASMAAILHRFNSSMRSAPGLRLLLSLPRADRTVGGGAGDDQERLVILLCARREW
jgi:hypothetical protein